MRTSGWIVRIMVLLCSAVTSRDRQGLAGEPRGIGRSEEHGCRGDVLRLADSSQRCLRLDLLAHVALRHTCALDTFRLHHSGVDGVDPDAAWPEFLGQ